MTGTVLNLRSPSIAQLKCSACGAKADASCNCGAPYLAAGQRAEVAVKANPEKSDRAIAEEIGVSDFTVRKARKKSTASDHAVGKRTGRDGKVRRLPTPKNPPLEMPTEQEAHESWQSDLYNMACSNLEKMMSCVEDMTDETRQRFFAHTRRKYNVELN